MALRAFESSPESSTAEVLVVVEVVGMSMQESIHSDGYNKMKQKNAHPVGFVVAAVLKLFHGPPDVQKPFRMAATLLKKGSLILSLTDRKAAVPEPEGEVD